MGKFSWCDTSSDSEPDLGGDEGPYLPETKGFLENCYYCNGRMRVETEKDPQFAVRLTYLCANQKDGGDHETKWWDVAVTEEIENIKNKVEEQSDEIRKMTLDKEVETAELLARMKSMETAFTALKDDLEGFSEELVKIKEDIVARLAFSTAEADRTARLIAELSKKRNR